MELNGDVFVDAPRQRVWAALNDTEVLRRCIPGCEAMSATSEHEKTATVAIKVGPVRARFNGQVRMNDIREGVGCTLQFEGQGGAAGMARGTSRVELSDDDSGTRLRYQTQASVAGKLGQVGGRLIDLAARQMADQFFAAFRTELAPVAAIAPAPITVQGNSHPANATSGALEDTIPSTPTSAVLALPGTVPTPVPVGESARVLWFVLGALSTGFGVWLGRTLFT